MRIVRLAMGIRESIRFLSQHKNILCRAVEVSMMEG
jgi:hypothetical protein